MITCKLKGGGLMKIRTEKDGNIKTIKIIGRVIVMEMETLRKELANLTNVKEIRIDVTETSYVDSSFLGLILHTKNNNPDLEMKILNPNDILQALLDIPEYKNFFTLVTDQ
jgi:anti-anti-sigma factor